MRKKNYVDNYEIFEAKAKELVAKMTLEEKASQLRYNAPAIKRLGIPSYNWWNEALHGVARAGTATVFPQAIGLAAMFDEEYLQTIGNIISTEGRAKYNMQFQQGDREIYKGLTFWSPNINIFRDPRWGRGHETYGEDPYLTSRLGVAFVKGLQGNGEYLKSAACAKHFAVHSGPEADRHSFDAIVSKKDLWETYLPAFEILVEEANVESVMGAYNRVNGEPSCGSKTLLKDILREKWNFKGHVVSDCGAIADFHNHHMVTSTATQSAALALTNGCDLNCGNIYLHVLLAYKEGLVTEEDIDKAAVRLMATRYKLGMFADDCDYDKIPYEINDCKEHNYEALNAARKSIVLLKNNGILPLNKNNIKNIAVIGPNAASKEVLKGNYCGTASKYVTNLEGIQNNVTSTTRVYYSEGCHLYNDRVEGCALPNDRISEAVTIAKISDVVVLFLGLDSTIEGEAGDANNSYAAGDKIDLKLPESQRVLLEEVLKTKTPTIVVINSGSALDLTEIHEKCDGVVQAWYSGAKGGQALAEVLFGEYCPGGRLPITFYKSTDDLPEFDNYSMNGRTYRYFDKEPLYPFGYGLSYSNFKYDNLTMDKELTLGEDLSISVDVTNVGEYPGDEVIQVYIKDLKSTYETPIRSLCGFKRVTIAKGETKKVSIVVSSKAMRVVDGEGNRFVESGDFEISIGGSQPDSRSLELMNRQCLSSIFTVK